ncbi:hypothetical protein B0H14DRAFT_2700915, partial [Mycena olivaceomarginata]
MAMPEGLALPTELEREVFETAALMHPRTIPTLLRVAKRVLIWIEPFLYRVIRLNDDNPHVYTALLRAIKAKPPDFFHDAIRHFAFVSGSDSAADAKKILVLCTGIVNFGCYNTLLDPTVPALFVGTRLQRLFLDLQSLFPPGCVDLGHSMFGYVTHRSRHV